MIFYDTVVKTIVDAVKEKTRETTNRLQNRILAIENTNLLFATKKEVEKKIGDMQSMIEKEKTSILGVIEEKISSVASMESVISLAKGINNRLDNMYMAMEVNKNQAVNQAKEIFEGTLKSIADNVASNTAEIIKNRSDTQELKTIVDNLVPQIIRTLDTSSLTSIIDSLVQVEMQAIEERLKNEMASGTTPDLSSTGGATQGDPISAGNVQSNSGSVEEEIPLQG